MTAKTIGIIACSAPGAALCYSTICADDDHPPVAMHGYALAEYMRCIERDDWRAVSELMLASAQKLAAAGADLLICPDNTIHQALPSIREQLPLPFLHIADVVMREAAARGFSRVALTGTKYLVGSDVYPQTLTRPAAEEREEINRIIFEQLVYGDIRPESAAYVQRVIERFRSEGCDAVALCCTEIPLLINETNSPLPVLDSTRLLARAALTLARGGSPGSPHSAAV